MLKKPQINRIHLALAVTTALSLAPATSVFAASGYAMTPDGSYVRDSFGDCVKTSTWQESDWNEACGKPAPKPEPVAKPAPKPAPPPPAPEPVMETVTLDGSTFFAFDKSNLDANSQTALDSIIEQLRTFTSVKSITITGHTDSIGTRAYNQALSERRANSVKDFLIGKGVNPALLSAMGAGEDQPVADNKTSEGRAKNRRAVIDIIGAKLKAQ